MRPIKIQPCLFVLVVFFHCARDKAPLQPGTKQTGIPSSMPQYDIPWPSLANSPWPMGYHDPQLTCRSQYSGPQIGELDWVASPIAYETTSGISIGADGTIYYSCFRYLFALNPDGSEKWRFDCYSHYPTPLIGADNTIYIPSGNGSFYAINPDGTLKWKKDLGVTMTLSPNIGLDGTLYFAARNLKLYALSITGNVLWSMAGFWNQCPALSPAGSTIYASGPASCLSAISTSGQIKWKIKIPGDFWNCFLVDNQGNIYVAPQNYNAAQVIYSFNPDGSVRWQYQYASLGPSLGFITMDKNGFIYFNDAKKGRIISLDYAGNFRWEIPAEPISSGLVCDKEGTIYYCSRNLQNAVVALSSTGIQKWNAVFSKIGNPELAPAIGNNKRLYRNSASFAGGIYCVK